MDHLHRQAWQQTIDEIGLFGTLSDFFPEERFSLEQRDSRRKIAKHFFATPANRRALEYFFGQTDKGMLTDLILDLKGSHLLGALQEITPDEMEELYSENVLPAISSLLSRDYKLGIISSARESIIIAALRMCKLEHCFSFIVGEESMRDSADGELQKQDVGVRDKIPPAILADLKRTPCYIGDDPRIDSLVAKNYGFEFIQATESTDFMLLQEWL